MESGRFPRVLGVVLLLAIVVGAQPLAGQRGASPDIVSDSPAEPVDGSLGDPVSDSSGALARSSTPGVLTGSVLSRSHARGTPLSHAQVRIVGPGITRWTTTDRSGRYVLEVPPGPIRVSVERVGYRPHFVEVRIPANQRVTLDVDLEIDPVPLAGVTASAVPHRVLRAGPDDGMQHGILGLRAIDVSPGLAQSGIGEAARGLAAAPDGEPAPTLLMRGSTADQKLLLLDGSPVYAPFHLGGLLPSFDDRLLARATHFVGGAPARYDGGLSYVLDLETRSARMDAPHGSAFLDLLGAGTTVETPLGARASILGSARILHDLGEPVFAGKPSPFGYGEALIRADMDAARGHRIAVTWFWNREDILLDLSRPGEATWQNSSLSARYRGRWGETELDATVANSRYRAALPLGLREPAWATAGTEWLRATTEMTHPVGPWRVQVGISAEAIDQRTHARSTSVDSVSEVRGRGRTRAAAIYVEGSRPLGESLEFRGALRLDHFPGTGGTHIAPRMAVTWRVTEAADLSLSAGRYFQLPRGGEMELGITLNDPASLSAGGALFPPAQATHLVVSLDQRLTPAVELGLDGFLKGFRDLPGAEGRVLRSSGVELNLRSRGEDLTGWLGYSLAWFWSPDGAAAGGAGTGTGSSPLAGEFAGRHLLTAGLDGRFGDAWGGALRISFGDGLPYTAVPVVHSESLVTSGAGVLQTIVDQTDVSGTDAPGRRIPTLDGFLRLDVELHREWDVSWGGRTGRFRPYVRVLNAVSSRDALFHYFDPWRSPELRALADRPVLPVVGAELRF